MKHPSHEPQSKVRPVKTVNRLEPQKARKLAAQFDAIARQEAGEKKARARRIAQGLRVVAMRNARRSSSRTV
jgi:hypothetical protein